jgi:hypothetical protein
MKCSRTPAKKGQSTSTRLIRRAIGPGTLWVKRRGRGTYANDRPPVLGTVGRVSGQVRLRVVTTTQQTTLRASKLLDMRPQGGLLRIGHHPQAYLPTHASNRPRHWWPVIGKGLHYLYC